MFNTRYGNRGFGMSHHFHTSGADEKTPFRIPVNISKNENQYEVMVFAPDRDIEDFRIKIKGYELNISYELKNDNIQNVNWIRHEFEKSSFERTFLIDEIVDTENVRAEYLSGILHLTLPIIFGLEKPERDIKVI